MGASRLQPLALSYDEAALHVERREQRCRAVTLVIVRHRRRAPLLHRQAGVCATERLDLDLGRGVAIGDQRLKARSAGRTWKLMFDLMAAV